MISTTINSLNAAVMYERLIYNSQKINSGEMNLPLICVNSESIGGRTGYDNISGYTSSINMSYKPGTLSSGLEGWGGKIEDIEPYVPSGKGMYFTIDNYLQSGQEKYTKSTIRPEHYNNAQKLVNKVNELGELIDYHGVISSGYRSPERQRQIYAQKGEKPAMGSKHLSGHALDIADPQGELKKKILNRKVLEKLKDLDLYLENFDMTKTWVHIQDEAPGFCGKQIWSADNLLEKHRL